VQGVGFRAATRREGQRLGLAGWVRNLPDGTVEVVAEGEGGTRLEALVAFLGEGPRGARVAGVDVIWEPARGDLPTPFEG
jgi:acylphosphatase